MRNIKKRILTDDAHRPVAIQIDYTDWLEIVRALNLEEKEARETDLSVHQAVIALTEDPLGYQQRIRKSGLEKSPRYQCSSLPARRQASATSSEMELFSYPLLDASAQAKIENFLGDVIVVGLNEEVKKFAIRLRKEQ